MLHTANKTLLPLACFQSRHHIKFDEKFLFGVEVSSAVDAPCNGQQPFEMLHLFSILAYFQILPYREGIDRAVHSPSMPQYKHYRSCVHMKW